MRKIILIVIFCILTCIFLFNIFKGPDEGVYILKAGDYTVFLLRIDKGIAVSEIYKNFNTPFGVRGLPVYQDSTIINYIEYNLFKLRRLPTLPK